MQGAGKDGTALFQRYHPWVNGHALLEACLLGSVKVSNLSIPANRDCASCRQGITDAAAPPAPTCMA